MGFHSRANRVSKMNNNLADWHMYNDHLNDFDHLIHTSCNKQFWKNPYHGWVNHSTGACSNCQERAPDEVIFAANLAGVYLNIRLSDEQQSR